MLPQLSCSTQEHTYTFTGKFTCDLFSDFIKKPAKDSSATSPIPVLPIVNINEDSYIRAKRMLFLHNKRQLVLVQDPESFPLHTSSILLYLTSPFLTKSVICDSAVLLSNAFGIPIIAVVENPGPCYQRLYRFLYGTYRITSIGINTCTVNYQVKDIITHLSVYFSANVVLTEYFPVFVKNEHQRLTPAHELSLTLSMLLRNCCVFYMCPYPMHMRAGPLQTAQLSNHEIFWDTRTQPVNQQGILPTQEFTKIVKRLQSHNTNYPQYPWTSPLISEYIIVYSTMPKEDIHEINPPSQLKDGIQLWMVENGSCLIREMQCSSNIYLMLRGVLLFLIVNSGLSAFHRYFQLPNKQSTIEDPTNINQAQRTWKDMDDQFEALSLFLERAEKNLDQLAGKSPQKLSEELTHMCSELLYQLTDDSSHRTLSHITIAAYLGYIPLEAFLLLMSKQKSTAPHSKKDCYPNSEDVFTNIYKFILLDTDRSNNIKGEDNVSPQHLLYLFYNSHVRALYLEMLQSLDITSCPIVDQNDFIKFSEKILSILQIQLLFALCSPSSLDQYFLFIFRTSFQYARPELRSPMPLVSRQYLAYQLTIMDIIAIISPIYRKMIYLYSLRYIESIIFAIYGKSESRDVFQRLSDLLPDFHSGNNQIHLK